MTPASVTERLRVSNVLPSLQELHRVAIEVGMVSHEKMVGLYVDWCSHMEEAGHLS